MCFLRPAEHPARNRTSLAGLGQDLLFFGPPYTVARDGHLSLMTIVPRNVTPEIARRKRRMKICHLILRRELGGDVIMIMLSVDSIDKNGLRKR